jgi:hypothetical protein
VSPNVAKAFDKECPQQALSSFYPDGFSSVQLVSSWDEDTSKQSAPFLGLAEQFGMDKPAPPARTQIWALLDGN